MLDRRNHSETTALPLHAWQVERRVRLLERRKHNNTYRIIHIDIREMWGFLASKWRHAN
jgi:hypothetical protein